MKNSAIVTIDRIISRNVISTTPDSSLLEAASIIEKNNFDGLPVVDKNNVLVGILTQYDLITKGSFVHLPTFQKILQNFSIVSKDRLHFQNEIKEIIKLTVRDVMNDDPMTLPKNASIEEAILAFKDHHRVNPIPVIDSKRKVVGVISRYDIVKLFNVIK